MLGRSPRTVALWIGAVVVAVVTAALVASDLAALRRRADEFGAERGAVVAARPLPLGATISRADVRVRRIHASQLPPGVLRDPDRALDRVITVPVVRGGFVAAGNLAPRARAGLDGALPVGTRAVRVIVHGTVHPRPGAAVDALASYDPTIGGDGLPSDDDPGSARVVAAGVSVLDAAPVRSAEADALGVTLLVSPRQARDLAYASTHGRIVLALVPPEEAGRRGG